MSFSIWTCTVTTLRDRSVTFVVMTIIGNPSWCFPNSFDGIWHDLGIVPRIILASCSDIHWISKMPSKDTNYITDSHGIRFWQRFIVCIPSRWCTSLLPLPTYWWLCCWYEASRFQEQLMASSFISFQTGRDLRIQRSVVINENSRVYLPFEKRYLTLRKVLGTLLFNFQNTLFLKELAQVLGIL